MPNYTYKDLGLALDLSNWEHLNENFEKVAEDLGNISVDVMNEVIDGAKLEYLPPVANFSALATTYPDVTEGKVAQTLNDNKFYRFNGTDWVFLQQFGTGPFTDVYNQLGLQRYYISVLEFGAKGDGTTDDTTAIQNTINFAYSNNIYTVFFPYRPNGYRIAGTLTINKTIKLLGENVKFIADASATTKAVINVKDLTSVAGDIEIEGITGVTTASTTLQFIQVNQFGKNLTLKNVKAQGFNYFLKIDPNTNPAVNVMTMTGVTVSDTVMPFMMVNVNKLVGDNISTTLRNTTKFDHHYYFLRNMKDITLKNIRADEGKGSVLQFNDSPSTEDEKVGTVYVENLKCKNIERLLSATMNIKKLEFKGVYVESFKTDATEQPLYLSEAVTKALIIIDDFYFAPCLPFISSAIKTTPQEAIIIRFLNGKFERIKGETSVSYINELTIRNVEYGNILFDTLGSSNLPVWFRVTANTVPVKITAQNVTMTVDPTLVPTLNNFHFIRFAGESDTTLDNIVVKSLNNTLTDTKGFFISKPDNLPGTIVRVTNSDIRTMNAFDFGTGTFSAYRKSNTYLKNALVA